MNDPRVVALHYRIEHESSVDYSKAEPVDHEEEGFRLRIEEAQVCFTLKDDYPTLDSALEVVSSYISNWELDAALAGGPGQFKLRFVRPEIVDRDPTPGEHRVSASPIFWEFATSVPTITVGRPYPKPPVGVSLNRNEDVIVMLSRYEDLLCKREKLPAVAQFCLTMLEKLAGNRSKVPKKFAIEKEVLSKVGSLAANKGGHASARKAKGINEELSLEETRFLKSAIKVFIRRVGEEAHTPGGPFRYITMNDFPELHAEHQQ